MVSGQLTLAEQQAIVVQSLEFGCKVALDFFLRGLGKRIGERSDCFQVAALGLIEAARRFDPERGSFKACARYWIRHCLQEAACNDGIIRIPTYVAKAMYGSRKAAPENIEYARKVMNVVQGSTVAPRILDRAVEQREA